MTFWHECCHSDRSGGISNKLDEITDNIFNFSALIKKFYYLCKLNIQ